jgi:hypothetical protein
VRSARIGAEAAAKRWILLLPGIPPRESSLRVRIWRQLQKIGAVALKNGVYVLPQRDECVEAFQWVARELVELGGQASLCEGQFFDGVSYADIERRFVETRDAEYGELSAQARVLVKSFAKRGRAPDGAGEQIAKLRRRLEEIVALDFCHAPGREAAEGLVTELERASAELGANPAARGIARVVRPAGARWVTRTGVHIDRIASAWLIRRFIDPAGTFKFVPPKGYEPEPGELRFDMYDAEFTHVGERCTFEVLLPSFGLDDAALGALAEIVHDIDLREAKFARPETAGVANIVNGVCAGTRDDLARIAAVSPMFDGLYTFFTQRGATAKQETSDLEASEKGRER